MKLNKFRIFAFTAVLLAMSSCSSEDPGVVSGGGKMVEVSISINVDLGGARTRTELSEADNTLKWQWSTDKAEKILVTDKAGERVSVLTLDEIVPNTDNKTATFKGLISVEEGTTGTDIYNFYYAGDGEDVSEMSGSHKIVLSNQSGKLADLQKLDVLSASKEIELNNTLIEVTELNMVHRLSAGKFHLTFPEGIASLKSLKLKGTNIKSNAYISLSEGMSLSYTAPTKAATRGDEPDVTGGASSSAGGDFVSGSASATVIVSAPAISVEVKDGELPSDVYLMLPPSLTTSDEHKLAELKFVAEDNDGNTYTGTIDADPFTLPNGKFLCLSNGDSIQVNMKLEGDDDDDNDNQEEVEDDEVVGPAFQITRADNNETVWVKFTRANLQYNTTDKSWILPQYQTDFICASGRRYSSGTGTNPETIGLFRWGTTGIEDDVYKPYAPDFWKAYAWQTNTRNVIDSQFPSSNTSVNATLNTNSTLCPGGTMQGTSWDWGKAYSQYKGEDEYLTLTSSQLNDLIDDNFVALGTVDGVNGAIMLINCNSLEDAQKKITEVGGKYNMLYKLSSGVSNTYIEWTRLTLTYDQLTELKGVFFPASGMNNPNETSDYSGTGYYWTSTVSTTPNAIAWVFDGTSTQSSRMFQVYGRGKGQAFSVRLVKVVTGPDDDEVIP